MKNEEIYLTQAEYSGPWLLDAKALKDLDARISSMWVILEDRRKAIIEDEMPPNLKMHVESGELIPEEIREQIVHYRDTHRFSQKSKKEFNIKYEESIFSCDSFGIALESPPGLDSKIPIGAAVKLVSADIECDIGLESNRIKVKIVPQDLPETQKLFKEIYAWVNQYKPLFLLNWWGKLLDAGKWFYISLYGFLAFGLIVLNLLQPSKTLDVQKLLDGGISEAEIPKAIEFLLVNAQTSPQLYFPPWFGVFSTIVVVISLILAFRPKIILGIGKKAVNRLTFWKYYYIGFGFVIVTAVTVGIEKLVSLFSP